MVSPELMEGTGEELRQMLERFPKSRFRLVPLPLTETQGERSDAIAEGGSLYDLLGDYIGCVHGTGDNTAERASELFTDYLVKKHSEGHL